MSKLYVYVPNNPVCGVPSNESEIDETGNGEEVQEANVILKEINVNTRGNPVRQRNKPKYLEDYVVDETVKYTVNYCYSEKLMLKLKKVIVWSEIKWT